MAVASASDRQHLGGHSGVIQQQRQIGSGFHPR